MKARSFWPLALAYVALRILLTVLLAVVVVLLARAAGLDMPVLVAAMLAVIVQLPLAWLVLGGMRRRLTAQIAASAGERRQLRGELRAALSEDRQYPGGTATEDPTHSTGAAGPARTPVEPAPDEAGRP